jgi:hypothetical protein
VEVKIDASKERLEVLRENMWRRQEEMKNRIGGCRLPQGFTPRQDTVHSIRNQSQDEHRSRNYGGSDQEVQEEIRATINCIRAELEETIKRLLEDVLVFPDRRTVRLREDLNGKIGPTRSYYGPRPHDPRRDTSKVTLVEIALHVLEAEMVGHGRFPPWTGNQSARSQKAASGGRGPDLVRSVPDDRNRRGRGEDA